MPMLKCKGKDCGYQTESVEDYVEHRIYELLPKPEPTETTAEPKRHETVEDFLNCPECFPKFEKAFIARGYTKQEEKKPEAKGEKKKGLL